MQKPYLGDGVEKRALPEGRVDVVGDYNADISQ